MKVAFLGIGSNLGDRRAQLAAAVRALSADPAVCIVHGSSIYETKPVGKTDQPDFLNMVIQVNTPLLPLALLAVCLDVEARLGRERRERWGPRTVDLDVLIYGTEQLNAERLVLPHPRMHERSFVMAPLAEIAPDVLVNGRTAREIASDLGMAGLNPIESWLNFSRWAKVADERADEK
ncbi:MAG: 2-amino-4-hydroxy-6-hydroxymethyldihydropteridine diphosphokinase [Lacunisphaera sp.]